MTRIESIIFKLKFRRIVCNSVKLIKYYHSYSSVISPFIPLLKRNICHYKDNFEIVQVILVNYHLLFTYYLLYYYLITISTNYYYYIFVVSKWSRARTSKGVLFVVKFSFSLTSNTQYKN